MYKDSRSKENKRDLLKELIKSNFKLKYNNSVLGFVWVLMKPFLSFLMLFAVFTAFRGGEADPIYASNLLLGIIIFTMVQEGVISGMHALLDLASVLLKINFPRQLAVTSALVMALVNFFINTIILIVIALIFNIYPEFTSVLYLLGIIGLLFVLLYAVALFSSIMLVWFRDLDHIVELGMTLLFWGSAIFYNMDDMDGAFRVFLKLNPFAVLIDAARKAIISDQIVHLKFFGVYWVIALILLYFGYKFFNKNIKRIAEDF